jgi:hypothetical protein
MKRAMQAHPATDTAVALRHAYLQLGNRLLLRVHALSEAVQRRRRRGVSLEQSFLSVLSDAVANERVLAVLHRDGQANGIQLLRNARATETHNSEGRVTCAQPETRSSRVPYLRLDVRVHLQRLVEESQHSIVEVLANVLDIRLQLLELEGQSLVVLLSLVTAKYEKPPTTGHTA